MVYTDIAHRDFNYDRLCYQADEIKDQIDLLSDLNIIQRDYACDLLELIASTLRRSYCYGEDVMKQAFLEALEASGVDLNQLDLTLPPTSGIELLGSKWWTS